MFKKKQEKQTAKIVATTTAGSICASSSIQTSGSHAQRTVTHMTSTTYSSISATQEIERSLNKTTLGSSSSFAKSPLLKQLPSSFIDKEDSKWQFDTKPFTFSSNGNTAASSSREIGYKSPFSRKLLPHSLSATDARPFNSGTETNLSLGVNRTLSPPSAFTRNESTYSSYRPTPTQTATPTNYLLPSPSTLSLPTTNESGQRVHPAIPTYNTNGSKRGKVLIINNIKFLEEKTERKGAKLDEENLGRLFHRMGFEIVASRDLTRSAMMKKLTHFKDDKSLKKVDMAIITLMSHGSNIDNSGRIVHGGFTQIYGVDNEGLQIDDVLNLFAAESCPALAGKPKIFIFQCCRGDRYEETLHNDAVPLRDIKKKHADMLIAFSTLPGFYSIRDIVQGSWYIQSICDVFQKHAKEFDVETLLKIVDQKLSEKHPTYQQTSTYESRGFKCCYLNPK